jgi:UDP-N-acetylmuramate--alanine ligase
MNKEEEHMRIYHLLGIGGSGMMPLALLLAARGDRVSGADRSFDRDPSDPRIARLADAGVTLLPESAPPPEESRLVVSSAIEGVSGVALHRSEALRDLLDRPGQPRILVAGSSGKTTTTAMIAWILAQCRRDPLVYVGGGVAGLAEDGARWGMGPAVAEIDESDGSIERFTADIATVTSVSEDHKPLAEIETLFRGFLKRSRSAVVSAAAGAALGRAEDGTTRLVSPLAVPASAMPGEFNRLNEALAVAAAGMIGISRDEAIEALKSFPGVHRRLEIIHRDADRILFDDFAHNPEKLAASLAALKSFARPTLVIFQPHGYGPTRQHAEAFGRIFSERLDAGDRVVLLPIHDAGGTADRSITSETIARRIVGVAVTMAANREEAIEAVRPALDQPTVIAVMGARDPSLPGFARQIKDLMQRR